jgi:hypothetical protein
MSFVSASHSIFQLVIVNHTSKTIAQTFIIFTFRRLGCQVATMIISACVVNFSKFLVLLLQAKIVAQAFINREIIGFQTILLLQITHTTFHSKATFCSLNSSINPAGVHGTNQLKSQSNTFP